MKEADLRKWHRRMGAALAIFIILQAGSGLVLSLREVVTPEPLSAHGRKPVPASAQHDQGATNLSTRTDAETGQKDGGILWAIHHKEGIMYSYYRSIVGFGTVGMAISGLRIFFAIRRRSRA